MVSGSFVIVSGSFETTTGAGAGGAGAATLAAIGAAIAAAAVGAILLLLLLFFLAMIAVSSGLLEKVISVGVPEDDVRESTASGSFPKVNPSLVSSSSSLESTKYDAGVMMASFMGCSLSTSMAVAKLVLVAIDCCDVVVVLLLRPNRPGDAMLKIFRDCDCCDCEDCADAVVASDMAAAREKENNSEGAAAVEDFSFCFFVDIRFMAFIREAFVVNSKARSITRR